MYNLWIKASAKCINVNVKYDVFSMDPDQWSKANYNHSSIIAYCRNDRNARGIANFICSDSVAVLKHLRSFKSSHQDILF